MNFEGDTLYYFALLNLIAVLFSIYLSRKALKKHFSGIGSKSIYALILLFIFALTLRIMIPPKEHILYMDEAIYMEAGKNLMLHQDLGVYNKSIGWPFLLIFPFKIFGLHYLSAIYTTIILGSLSAAAVYLITSLITDDLKTSVFSSLLFSLLPTHIRWSSTAENIVPWTFFILLSFFAFLLHQRYKDMSLAFLGYSFFAFACQFRTESIILLIPLLFISYRNNSLLGALFVILAIPNLMSSSMMYMGEIWYDSESPETEISSNFSMERFTDNILPFLKGLFEVSYLSIPFFIMGFINKKREASIISALWFISLIIIYSFSWVTDFQGNDRLYNSLYPFICIFCGIGILNLSRWTGKKWIPLAAYILIIALLLPKSIGARSIHSSSQTLLETKMPEILEKGLGEDCILIANHPEIFSATTLIDVISIDDFFNKKVSAFDRGCVYFIEDYTCIYLRIPGIGDSCMTLLEKEEFKEVRYYHLEGSRYTLYLLD